MRQRKNPVSASGLTLIELLIVIAMIGILAAILFPVFARAREQARRSVCGSNLKQVGVAAALYRTDYDGVFPYAADPGQQRYQPEVWQPPAFYGDYPKMPTIPDVLQPYCHSQQIFACPSDYAEESCGGDQRLGVCYPHRTTSMFDFVGSSYDFDERLGLFSVPESAIHFPSNDYYAEDAGAFYHSYKNAEVWETFGNAVFIDGHVKFLLQPGYWENEDAQNK